jgi:RimJ/RimL family protein N-acetyltransferase
MGFSLHTTRLTLRDYAANDYDLIRALFLPPALTPQNLSEQASEAYVNEHFEFGRAQTRWHPRLAFDLVVATDHETVGVCGLNRSSCQPENASLNWHIRPTHWRRGYATEAAARLVEFSFIELNLTSIEANAFADNAASIRVMEKLGLRPGQNTNTAAWWRGLTYGEAHPVFRYSLTNEEWLASRVYAAASHSLRGNQR